MGHRDDLLEGAKRCLIEIGYARTTARDIVAASNTNLASIGYHYGSKEALLNEALISAMDDQGEEMMLAMVNIDFSARPMKRFEAIWAVVVDHFATRRQLWLSTFEICAQVDRAPEVRKALADSIQRGREGLVALFHPDAEKLDDDARQALGSFFQALMTGVMTQWLVDPARSPDGHSLAQALGMIMGWEDAGPYPPP